MTNVKSAQRTLEILELMERLRQPMKVSQIARMLAYPQSSTSILLNSLKDLGYLNFNPETHEFAPSIRVALVGGYLRFDGFHAHHVLDLLSAVRDETGCTTILSSRNGVHVQYVHLLTTPDRGVEGLRAGSLRPLTSSAAGMALLAACPDDEIGRIVRHLNVLPDERERASLTAVLSIVNRIRETGYCVMTGRLVPDRGSVAVRLPVRDSFGKVMAISVAASTDVIEDRQDAIVTAISNRLAAMLAG